MHLQPGALAVCATLLTFAVTIPALAQDGGALYKEYCAS